MNRLLLSAVVCCCLPLSAATAQLQTRTVVLIVADGLRWQEVFGGVDTTLIARTQGVGDTAALRRDFARPTVDRARLELMPFLWSVVARQGQVYGNRPLGSDGHITNGMKFSYPGYNELLTGAADPRIDRNGFGPNPNVTVFEWLARQADIGGDVAALGTWDVFRDIFARARTGLWVRSGWDAPFPSPLNDRQRLLDELYRSTIRYWDDNAFDALLHSAALETIRQRKPRLLFVGYGETDEWAHERRYDLYLRSARQVDNDIGELWNAMQAMPEYRGKTTFIITSDHGRGRGNDWTDHGRDVAGAEEWWVAILGPDTPALGEMRDGVVTQGQVAATIAALLGYDWLSAAPSAAPPLERALR